MKVINAFFPNGGRIFPTQIVILYQQSLVSQGTKKSFSPYGGWNVPPIMEFYMGMYVFVHIIDKITAIFESGDTKNSHFSGLLFGHNTSILAGIWQVLDPCSRKLMNLHFITDSYFRGSSLSNDVHEAIFVIYIQEVENL